MKCALILNVSCRWTEHDALEILKTIEECIEGALKDAESKGLKLKVTAVGITNQRETTVVWDKGTGKPLYRAIVWFDNRTAPICHSFVEKLGSAVSRQEGTQGCDPVISVDLLL